MADSTVAFLLGGIIFGWLIPMWLYLHYSSKNRRTQMITASDEQKLDDLFRASQTLEKKLENVEKILDADYPRWRKE